MIMRIIVFIILIIPFKAALASETDSFFELADSFFQRFIRNGLVDYQSVSSDPSSLDELARVISEINLVGASTEEKKAFYINTYNLLVIKGIIEEFPVSSPMNIAGFFDRNKHDVGGEKLTLDDIEKRKLVKTTGDARLHFVLVCAAMSCPRIADFAYRPDNLDALLNKRSAKALNDPNFVRVGTNQVLVSQIFNWYKDDFTKESNSILEYLNQYRNSPLGPSYKLAFYEWNWSLNEFKQ